MSSIENNTVGCNYLGRRRLRRLRPRPGNACDKYSAVHGVQPRRMQTVELNDAHGS